MFDIIIHGDVSPEPFEILDIHVTSTTTSLQHFMISSHNICELSLRTSINNINFIKKYYDFNEFYKFNKFDIQDVLYQKEYYNFRGCFFKEISIGSVQNIELKVEADIFEKISSQKRLKLIRKLKLEKLSKL